MRSRMNSGPDFVIVGTRLSDDGKAMLTASQQVRQATLHIDRREERNYWERNWGGSAVLTGPNSQVWRGALRDEDTTFEIDMYPESLVQVIADDYPGAWRKLFDLWVPPTVKDESPSMTVETQAQILTHYTFNEPSQRRQPAWVNPNPAYDTVWKKSTHD